LLKKEAQTGMVNFKQLEAIYWLRELNSFQKVADRLHVTQPAVSTRIATLEEVIDARLVDRNPTGISLTNLGREVADHAERLILQRDAMLNQVRRDRKNTFRVALVGPILHTWGPDFKARLSARLLDLSIEFTVGSNVQIERDIRAGAVDFAFLSLLPQEDQPSTSFSVAYKIGWIGAPEIVETLPQPASKKDLGSKDLVLYPPTSPLFSPVAHHLPKVTGLRHFANSLSTILDMLRCGYGLSAIPTAVVRQDIELNKLKVAVTKDEIKPLIVYCLTATRRRQNEAKAVLEIAAESAREYAALVGDDMKFIEGSR
jgi:DNA-binding transcriptional LysR family regulator